MSADITSSNIIITGFMGTGKTTVAEMVAQQLGKDLLSIDDLIVEAAGKSIPQIFAEDGEATFRQIEAHVCRQAVDGSGRVISTGGGTLINDDTRAYCLAHGLVICLNANFNELVVRLGTTDASRPLFQNPAQAEALYMKRKPIYDSLPHQVDTTNRTPEQVTQEIIEICQQLD